MLCLVSPSSLYYSITFVFMCFLGSNLKPAVTGENEFLDPFDHSSPLTQLYMRVASGVMDTLKTGQKFQIPTCHSIRVCSSNISALLGATFVLLLYKDHICIVIRYQLKISSSVIGFRSGMKVSVVPNLRICELMRLVIPYDDQYEM